MYITTVKCGMAVSLLTDHCWDSSVGTDTGHWVWSNPQIIPDNYEKTQGIMGAVC